MKPFIYQALSYFVPGDKMSPFRISVVLVPVLCYNSDRITKGGL